MISGTASTLYNMPYVNLKQLEKKILSKIEQLRKESVNKQVQCSSGPRC